MMFINIALSEFMEIAKDPKKQTDDNLQHILKNHNIGKSDLSDYLLAILKDDTSSYFTQTSLYEASDYFIINKYILNFLDQNNDNLKKLYSFIPSKGYNQNHTEYFRDLFKLNIEPETFKELAEKCNMLSIHDNFFYVLGAMFYNNNKVNAPKFLSENLLSYVDMYKESNPDEILKISHMFLLDNRLISFRNDIIKILNESGDYHTLIKEELINFYKTGKIKNENHIYLPSENMDFMIKTVFNKMTNEEIRSFFDEIKKEKNNYLNKTPYKKLITYFIERDLFDIFDEEKNKVLLTQAGYLPFNKMESILDTVKDEQLKISLLSSFIDKCSHQQTVPFLNYIDSHNFDIDTDNHTRKIIKGFSDYFCKKDANKIQKIFLNINKYADFQENKKIYTDEIFNVIKINLKNSDLPEIKKHLEDIFKKTQQTGIDIDFSLLNKERLDRSQGTLLHIGIEHYILLQEVQKNGFEQGFVKKRI